MASSINPSVRALRLALKSRSGAYKLLSIEDDGRVLNKATGIFYDGLTEATSAVEQENLVDFRQFFPGGKRTSVSQSTGAGILESQVSAVNQYLRNASGDDLRRNGLGHLIGKQVQRNIGYI
jgi:hypothetical protein